MASKHKKETWLKRKLRMRFRVRGTCTRPRLNVYRSNRYIYAQVIDDEKGGTLVCASSRESAIQNMTKGMKKTDIADKVGQVVAERCLAKSIGKVVFDRNGFIYHGRISKLAHGARSKGLDF
jgi:large subunit ribosomal protein L18